MAIPSSSSRKERQAGHKAAPRVEGLSAITGAGFENAEMAAIASPNSHSNWVSDRLKCRGNRCARSLTGWSVDRKRIRTHRFHESCPRSLSSSISLKAGPTDGHAQALPLLFIAVEKQRQIHASRSEAGDAFCGFHLFVERVRKTNIPLCQ
jgi:hypothetical protein